MTRKEGVKEIFKSILDAKSQFDAYGIESTEYNLKVNEKFFNCLDMAIKVLEQEPCKDYISRAEAIEINKKYHGQMPNDINHQIWQELNNLPSIQPKQKIGHWILIDKELSRYKCSECGEVIRLYKKSEISKLEKDETLSDYPFSHCGCRMVEPQESEG